MNQRSETGQRAVFVAIGCVTLLGLHIVLIWTGSGTGLSMIRDRVLIDTDAYSWLNRVHHMVESGSWWDHLQPRISPPDGHVQHWTRPLDALLLAGGTAYGWFLGFGDGLYFWALTLTPLLHLLTLAILLWAVRPLVRCGRIEKFRLPLLILLFLVQIPLYQIFRIGRPDHHALMALMFVAYLGFWLRVLLQKGDGAKSSAGLGLVGAVSLWVNVEALLFVAVGVVSLGVGWLFGDRRLGRRNAIHGLALVAGVGSALAVEWGPYAVDVWEMDTLSVPYFGLMTLTAALAFALWKTEETGIAGTPPRRAVLTALGGGAVLVVLRLGFPGFFASPLAGVDALYAETRLQHISELQSLGSFDEGLVGTIGSIVALAGTGFVVLPYLLLLSLRESRVEVRIMWLTFALLVGLYLALAWQQQRWTDYLALSALVPFFHFVISVLRRLEAHLQPRRLRLARPAATATLILGPLLLALGLTSAGGLGEHNETSGPGQVLAVDDATLTFETSYFEDPDGECSLPRIGEVLADETWFPEPGLVLAHTDYGPSLLYRTSHSVLSIPNHRPQSGYTFMHRVMSSTDPEEATAMLRERDVGALVLCASDIKSGFMQYPEIEDPFVEWLAAGGIPEGYALHVSTPVVHIYRAE